MVSQIKVNEIIKQSGSSISIGESGDTITLPSTATLTNFPDNTPAFQAQASSSQSISSGAWTKVTLGTELIDTDDAFSSNKFTVANGQAGKYFFMGSVNTYSGSNNITNASVAIYKNGSILASTYSFIESGGTANTRHFTPSIYTIEDASVGDYYELYGYISGTSPSFVTDGATPRSTNFIGYKLIGA